MISFPPTPSYGVYRTFHSHTVHVGHQRGYEAPLSKLAPPINGVSAEPSKPSHQCRVLQVTMRPPTGRMAMA